MTLPVPSFASLTAGNQPLSLLDQQFTAVAESGTIACTAIGTNIIALTPNPNNFVPTTYTDGAPRFVWVQPVATILGPVTINVAGIGPVTAYKANGSIALGQINDLVANNVYTATYSSRLGSGSGGFSVDVLPAAPIGLPLDGAAGTVLTKNSAADFDTIWKSVALAPLGSIVSIKDYGAKGDGVTDDSAAFLAFNAWAVTQTTGVYLLIPAGNYAGLLPTLVGPTQPRGGADFYRGISDLTIFAYGATLANIYRLGPLQVNNTGVLTVSARLQAVPLGSSSVTLVNIGDAANFAVGNWVMVSSLEMQGQQGFPPNWYYFDYAQIQSIAGTTVTFAQPLLYAHKSTYPQTVLPANVPTVGFDCGGPASMFLMLQDWNQSVKIMGMTVLGTGGFQAGLTAKRFELIDCNFPGTAGAMISNCMEAIFQRCQMGPTFQPDKINSVLRMDNCQFTRLHLTSSSTDKMKLSGCNISTIDAGMMKNTEIDNCNIGNFQISPCAFGTPLNLIVRNTQISSVPYTVISQNILLSLLTFTNGTFAMPLTQTVGNLQNVYRFAIPGSKVFFGATGNTNMNYGNPFIITAVYEDSSNVYFDTTLTAVPTYTGGPGGANCLVQHPCPRLTGVNVTGAEVAVQLGKGTPGAPIYSYAHKVYGADLTNVVANIIPIRQWGNLVSLKINVIRADTGANVTLMLNPLGQFGDWVTNTSNAISQYNPRVDLKTAGLRTITPLAVTGSAGADVLGAAPGVIWFMQYGLWPLLSLSITGNTAVQMPIVEIELITDQGITAYEYNAL